MKKLALPLLALLTFQQAHAQVANSPSRREAAVMDEIEKRVELPPGAAPSLWVYVRKYTYMPDKTVVGIYVNQTMVDSRPGRAWVTQSQMPHISGGGCGVVTVFYDPAKNAPPKAMCNSPK